MAMAYYTSDRFEGRQTHLHADVSVEDEDKNLDANEVGLRVRATQEPSETVFAHRQEAKSKLKWRGVKLGSFVCGCFAAGDVYDSISSTKSNSVRAPPTDSTSAASDGTPFDNADSLGSEPDLFEHNTIVGAELTAARMQPLPSTGFADGMVPQAYYQQSVFEEHTAPTLLSHRSLQVSTAYRKHPPCHHNIVLHQVTRSPLQRTATYSPSSRHAGPPTAFFSQPESTDCDLPEVYIPQEVSHCHSSPARLQRHQTLSSPPYHAVQAGGIAHAYLPAANTVCVRYQPARINRSTTLA